jgi:YD repeat-containing protein
MASRFQRYRMRDGVTPLSARFFNPVFQDMDVRLVALEAFRQVTEEATRDAIDNGLARVNAVLVPMLEAAQASLDAGQVILNQVILDAQAAMDTARAEAQAGFDTLLAEAAAEVAAIQNALADVVLLGTLNARLAFVEPALATEYVYDANGRLESSTETLADASVRTTSLTYDAQGRLHVQTITARGIVRTETHTYDANSRLAGVIATEVAQ